MTNLTLTSDLSGLLGRVEEATGADRELDGAIAVAVDGFWTEPSHRGEDEMDYIYRDPGGSVIRPGYGGLQLVRPYTASLDADLALCERLGMNRAAMLDAALSPILAERDDASASEIACALLAATLRALIAQGEARPAEPLSRSGRK